MTQGSLDARPSECSPSLLSPVGRPQASRFDRRSIKAIAAHARASVADQGFVSIEDLFSTQDLAALSNEIATLFAQFDDLRARGSQYEGWAYAMNDRGGLSAQRHQPEILHLTRILPALTETAVFRQVSALAAAMGLNRFRFDHAILKRPFDDTRTVWHQDAQYASKRYRGEPEIHFWIPFEDATIENGCLEYVPGSHRKGLVAHRVFERDAPKPGWEASPLDRSHAVFRPVRAGGLVMHTPLTLHASGGNQTATPRCAWVLHFDRQPLLSSIKQRVLKRGKGH